MAQLEMRGTCIVVPVRTDVTAGCFGDMTRDKSEAGGTTKVTRDDRSDLKMPSSYSIIVERDEHFLSAVSLNIPCCNHS